MLIRTRNIFRNNSLFFLNIFILVFLVYGLMISYGTTYIGKVGIYLLAFVGAYFLINRQFGKTKNELKTSFIEEKWLSRLLDFLIIFVAVFQVIHYFYIGNVPVIKAMMTTDYYYIAKIRQDIKSVDSTLVNYTASFIIKALIPVLLYVLYDKDRKRFWIFLLFAGFYSLALMQKAYILTIFIPLILNFILTKRWLHILLPAGVFIPGIVFLLLVTNPALRPFTSPEELTVPHTDDRNTAIQVSDALYDRVFITTGKMVGYWFYFVPDSLPQLNGDGYRFVAPLKGGKYRDYSREIYDKVYLKEAAMGFTGTATTAYFMYDYANFGSWGLIFAGFYLAFFLIIVKWIFKGDYINMFALNGLFIIWLSSASFTSTLFSGGWVLTILLYLLFKPYFKAGKILKSAEENN